MSTIIIIGGGPHPQARIVALQEIQTTAGSVATTLNYAIFDGMECLGVFEKISYAQAILPLMQRGE